MSSLYTGGFRNIHVPCSPFTEKIGQVRLFRCFFVFNVIVYTHEEVMTVGYYVILIFILGVR